MGQICHGRSGAASCILRDSKLRLVQVRCSQIVEYLLPTICVELFTLFGCSWNSGATFLTDANTQDCWWRLIVYFDVLGMAVTSGAPFDSFFASHHVAAFADLLQVESSSQLVQFIEQIDVLQVI